MGEGIQQDYLAGLRPTNQYIEEAPSATRDDVTAEYLRGFKPYADEPASQAAFMQQEQDTTLPDFLKSVEGTKLTASINPMDGNLDIGHGHVVLPDDNIKEGDAVTEEQSAELLTKDISKATQSLKALVNEVVLGSLNNNQRAAITSLIFNVGKRAFRRSEALVLLNKGDIEGFKREAFDAKRGFVRTDPKGPALDTLIKRRAKELELFNS